MGRKKTHQEFEKQVKEKGKGEYKLQTKYEKDNIKVKLKHLLCGKDYEVKPSSFLQGRRCPHCRGRKISEALSASIEYVKKRAQQLNRVNYKILDVKKENGYIYLFVKHIPCNREYWTLDSNYRQGKSCRHCAFNAMGKRYRKKHLDFAEEVKNIAGDDFEVLGEYKTSYEKIAIKHKVCGYINYILPSHFTSSGTRCPKCSGKLKGNTEEYKKEVQKITGKEYQVLGEYISAKTPIKMKHISCGLEFQPMPSHFLRGSRCPACATSRGEQSIKSYLTKKEISFSVQYKTPECINKLPLPFDFAVYDKKNVVALIEYQGKQHYEVVEFFGGGEGFTKRKANDLIKITYCKNNKIPLIEISYKEKDIETVLEKKLKELAL